MMVHCSFVPESIWLRNVENGVRRITLRRNFTQETTIRQDKEESQFTFEETDVYIPDRENIIQFITENFGNLFDLGLQQTEEIKTKDKNIQKTKHIIETGQISEDMQLLGQQITNLMLGV